MHDLLKVIQYLKQQRAQIVFDSEEDEGAAEWHGHLTDVIEDLEAGKMTIEQAADSLGMNLI
jgi:ADP-heptose:LPS heptosyltransferase